MLSRKFLFFIAAFFLLAGPAQAQTGGKIEGTVVDNTGQPIPGANVVIEGTQRGAITGADGFFFIIPVEPGVYVLRATMVGYTPSTKTNVRVVTDLTSTVNFQLNEEALELGEITVVAERPAVEPDRTDSRYVVSAQDIEVLPIVRSMDAFIQLEAGVEVDGSNRIRSAYTASGGEQAEYVVDGIRLTHQDGRRSGGRGFTQNWTGNVNTSVVSEITVLAGGLNAEYGNIGSIQVVTRDGGRNYHGQMHYRYSPSGQQHWGSNVYESPIHRGRLQYDNTEWANETDAAGRLVHQRPSKDYTDVIGHFMEGSLSGPITRNLSFIVSSKHNLSVRNTPRPDQRTPFNADVSYRLTAEVRQNLKMRAGGLYSHQKGRYQDGFNAQAIFLPKGSSAGGNWTSSDNLMYVAVTHLLSPRTFYEIRVSNYTSRQDTSNIPVETKRPTLDKDGWFWTDPGTRREFQVGRQNRFVVRADLSSQVNRTNYIKGGITLTRYNAWKINHWEDPLSLNRSISYFGKEARFEEGVTPLELVLYIQDKMEFEGLIVNAGLRYERFWNEPVLLIPYQSPPMTGTLTRFVEHARYGNMQPLQWFLPRIGVSHPISEKSKLHFFYGKYHTRPDLDLFFRNNWAALGGLASIDRNGDGVISSQEENNNLVENDSFGNAFAIDQFLTMQNAQVSTAFELGTDWNFVGDYVLQATTYYRVTNGFLGVQSSNFVDPERGAKARTRTLGPRRHATTRGTELSVRKGMGHNFSFKAAINLGWGDLLTIGGTARGQGEFDIYPDASFIADPSRYWNAWTTDPNTGAEIPNPPTGEKLAQLMETAQARVDLGLAGELATGAQYRTDFLPLWEQSGLSAEERDALRGLYGIQTTGWSVEAQRGDMRSTGGSLVFVYASPPDFGPGGMYGGSRLLGDVRVNLIYRIYTGNVFRYIDPITSLQVDKEGPTVSTVDFSLQKGFNIQNIRPLFYLEINNLFNHRGSAAHNPDYIRWGLMGPRPNDPLYVQFGDVDELSRFPRSTPRQVFAGVRVTW